MIETGMVNGMRKTNRPSCYFIGKGTVVWLSMPFPALCNHTRSVCPTLVTRLETDLAGVWLIRLLQGTYLRLHLYLSSNSRVSTKTRESYM